MRFVSTVSKYNLHIEKDEGKLKFSDKSHFILLFAPIFSFSKVRR